MPSSRDYSTGQSVECRLVAPLFAEFLGRNLGWIRQPPTGLRRRPSDRSVTGFVADPLNDVALGVLYAHAGPVKRWLLRLHGTVNPVTEVVIQRGYAAVVKALGIATGMRCSKFVGRLRVFNPEDFIIAGVGLNPCLVLTPRALVYVGKRRRDDFAWAVQDVSDVRTNTASGAGAQVVVEGSGRSVEVACASSQDLGVFLTAFEMWRLGRAPVGYRDGVVYFSYEPEMPKNLAHDSLAYGNRRYRSSPPVYRIQPGPPRAQTVTEGHYKYVGGAEKPYVALVHDTSTGTYRYESSAYASQSFATQELAEAATTEIEWHGTR